MCSAKKSIPYMKLQYSYKRTQLNSSRKESTSVYHCYKRQWNDKKGSDIQQAKDAFASRLVAVRNMVTPCGTPMLDSKGPTRDQGPVRLCLSSNTRVLGRDGA